MGCAKGGGSAGGINAISARGDTIVLVFRTLRMLRYDCSFISLPKMFVGITPCARMVIVNCHRRRFFNKKAPCANDLIV